MSEQVRQLVGLENLLVKARRRYRECEREVTEGQHPRAELFRLVIERVSDEMRAADADRLQEYLEYLETNLLPRMGRKVEDTLDTMVQQAACIVDSRHHINEMRAEYTDALDRIRTVRERLGLDPFKPQSVKFGLGTYPPHADRRIRDAFDIVKGYLRA